MYEKKLQISSIISQVLVFMITKVKDSFQNVSSKYHVVAIFIFNIGFLNYIDIMKCFGKYIRFVSNGIKTNHFFQIPKTLLYLLNIPLLFSKNQQINTEKQNKISKKICFTFKIIMMSIIIIGSFFIINIWDFKNIKGPKMHIDLISTIDKFLKIINNTSIVPLFSLWLNDNEIIWDAGVGCENESIGQGRSYYNKNIDISNCFFSRYLSYSGDGGVIYVNGGSYSMNINLSMFHNCVADNGGAIYFISTNSSLRMLCANSCSCGANYYYHFAYFGASQMNQVEYLSVSNCSHTTDGLYSIWIESGIQRVDHTNSSMNNAFQVSGIIMFTPSSLTSSHCTFSNNKVLNIVCIYFYSESGTILMSYANIVHNNSPYNGVVFVEGGGSRMMMYCIFQNNQNTLFGVRGGSLEVSHSFIYHSASFSNENAVSTSNNNTFTNRMTYQFQFFNSLHCGTDSPERTPDQTPMNTLERSLLNTPNETPYSTPEESPIRSIQETLRMTYEKTIRETPMYTPIRSIQETIRRTNEETLRMTYEKTNRETLIKTLNESPINTIDQTIRETPKETIHRSFAECMCTNQMANKKEISVIFALVYPVINLMIS